MGKRTLQFKIPMSVRISVPNINPPYSCGFHTQFLLLLETPWFRQKLRDAKWKTAEKTAEMVAWVMSMGVHVLGSLCPHLCTVCLRKQLDTHYP